MRQKLHVAVQRSPPDTPGSEPLACNWRKGTPERSIAPNSCRPVDALVAGHHKILRRKATCAAAIVLTCTSFSIFGEMGQVPFEQHDTC